MAKTRYEDETDPRAMAARYERDGRRLVVELKSGVTFLIPVALVQGIAGGDDEALAQIEILPGGEALRWPALNAEMLVPQQLAGAFGPRAWMRELAVRNGRLGGSMKSAAKSAAAQANGRRGGRPRKVA